MSNAAEYIAVDDVRRIIADLKAAAQAIADGWRLQINPLLPSSHPMRKHAAFMVQRHEGAVHYLTIVEGNLADSQPEPVPENARDTIRKHMIQDIERYRQNGAAGFHIDEMQSVLAWLDSGDIEQTDPVDMEELLGDDDGTP